MFKKEGFIFIFLIFIIMTTSVQSKTTAGITVEIRFPDIEFIKASEVLYTDSVSNEPLIIAKISHPDGWDKIDWVAANIISSDSLEQMKDKLTRRDALDYHSYFKNINPKYSQGLKESKKNSDYFDFVGDRLILLTDKLKEEPVSGDYEVTINVAGVDGNTTDIHHKFRVEVRKKDKAKSVATLEFIKNTDYDRLLITYKPKESLPISKAENIYVKFTSAAKGDGPVKMNRESDTWKADIKMKDNFRITRYYFLNSAEENEGSIVDKSDCFNWYYIRTNAEGQPYSNNCLVMFDLILTYYEPVPDQDKYMALMKLLDMAEKTSEKSYGYEYSVGNKGSLVSFSSAEGSNKRLHEDTGKRKSDSPADSIIEKPYNPEIITHRFFLVNYSDLLTDQKSFTIEERRKFNIEALSTLKPEHFHYLMNLIKGVEDNFKSDFKKPESILFSTLDKNVLPEYAESENYLINRSLVVLSSYQRARNEYKKALESLISYISSDASRAKEVYDLLKYFDYLKDTDLKLYYAAFLKKCFEIDYSNRAEYLYDLATLENSEKKKFDLLQEVLFNYPQFEKIHNVQQLLGVIFINGGNLSKAETYLTLANDKLYNDDTLLSLYIRQNNLSKLKETAFKVLVKYREYYADSLKKINSELKNYCKKQSIDFNEFCKSLYTVNRSEEPVAVSFSYIDGKKADISDFKGKYIFIQFWETWCGYCKDNLAQLKVLRERGFFEKNDIVFLTAASDGSVDEIREFAKNNGYNFPVVLDEGDYLKKLFGVKGVPCFSILDDEGRLLLSITGSKSDMAGSLGLIFNGLKSDFKEIKTEEAKTEPEQKTVRINDLSEDELKKEFNHYLFAIVNCDGSINILISDDDVSTANTVLKDHPLDYKSNAIVFLRAMQENISFKNFEMNWRALLEYHPAFTYFLSGLKNSITDSDDLISIEKVVSSIFRPEDPALHSFIVSYFYQQRNDKNLLNHLKFILKEFPGSKSLIKRFDGYFSHFEETAGVVKQAYELLSDTEKIKYSGVSQHAYFESLIRLFKDRNEVVEAIVKAASGDPIIFTDFIDIANSYGEQYYPLSISLINKYIETCISKSSEYDYGNEIGLLESKIYDLIGTPGFRQTMERIRLYNPNSDYFLAALANCYNEMGLYKDALEIINDISGKDSSLDILLNIYKVESFIGLGRQAEAFDELAKLDLECNCLNKQALMQYINFYLTTGKRDKAVESLRRMLYLDIEDTLYSSEFPYILNKNWFTADELFGPIQDAIKTGKIDFMKTVTEVITHPTYMELVEKIIRDFPDIKLNAEKEELLEIVKAKIDLYKGDADLVLQRLKTIFQDADIINMKTTESGFNLSRTGRRLMPNCRNFEQENEALLLLAQAYEMKGMDKEATKIYSWLSRQDLRYTYARYAKNKMDEKTTAAK